MKCFSQIVVMYHANRWSGNSTDIVKTERILTKLIMPLKELLRMTSIASLIVVKESGRTALFRSLIILLSLQNKWIPSRLVPLKSFFL